MIPWEVPFQAGELLVKGYKGNEEVAEYRLVTPGPASDLKIETTKSSSQVGEKEIIHLDVTLVDADGNRITNDDREVIFEIEGPAILLGLESGDRSSHESYLAQKRRTYKGQLRAYIQSNAKHEGIKINITSAGLPGKQIF